MLFAAGFGTRMGALTRDRPKPMVEVAGKPLIDHALALAQEAPISKILANTHYLPDMLETHLAAQGIAFLREVPDILDTGGGLRNALPHLGPGPVMTLNTDAVWAGLNPLTQLMTAWNPDQMDALLLCVPMAQVHGRTGTGDFTLDPSGRITRGPEMVYAGAQILKTDLLSTVPDTSFSLNVIWDLIAQDRRLFGIQYPGHWCDVGHPQGIAEAQAMLNAYHV